MIEVSPLRAPGTDPWLGRLAAAGLDLWLARGRPADLDAALVRIVDRNAAERWVLEVRGGRGAARYVREVAAIGPGSDAATTAAATAAVDAAATTRSGLLLVQPAAGPPRLGVVRSGDGGWAVLAVRPGLDPTGMLAAAWSSVPVSPPLPPPPHRRQDWRVAAAALATTAAVVGGAVGGTVALRRQGGGTPATNARVAPTPRPPRVVANPGLTPWAPSGSAVAFDPHHGVALLVQAESQSGQTWTWGGRYWSQAVGRVAPSGRSFAALAFDPGQGDMVLFGGLSHGPSSLAGDTWTWDGTGWTPVPAVGPQPPPSISPLLATAAPTDPAGDSLLLVDDGTTWGWNSGSWRQRPASAVPVQRGTASLALDSAARTDVLVGESPGSPEETTWRWDGGDWTKLHPVHEPPAGPYSRLAADPVTGHLVLTLIGGGGFSAALEARTWTWDGSDWSERSGSALTAMPTALFSDTVAGLVIAVMGGAAGIPGAAPEPPPLQTLAWTGSTWVPIASALDASYDGQEPSPRTFAGSAADPVTGAVLLVGGQQFGSDAPLNPLGDVWTWSGAAWVAQPPGPPARASPLMAPDPHGGVILVGGTDAARDGFFTDAWRWADGAWIRLPSPVAGGPGLASGGMATDPRLGTAVLLGACCAGQCCQDGTGQAMQTSTWDGTAWSRRHPAHSPPPGPALLVDDPARGRVLALVEPAPSAATPDPSGKVSLALATWAWDGRDWHDLGEEVLGPVRGAAADPVTGDIVALGDPVWGSGGTQLFDGRSWLRRPLPNEPDTVVAGSPMLVDPRLDRLTVLSGPAGQLNEEWMWTGLSWIQLDVSAQH